MKKVKRSVWIIAVLFIYITAMCAYLAPRNTDISTTEKIVTVASSYVVLILLWFVLRRKERIKEQRLKEEKDNQNQNKN